MSKTTWPQKPPSIDAQPMPVPVVGEIVAELSCGCPQWHGGTVVLGEVNEHEVGWIHSRCGKPTGARREKNWVEREEGLPMS